MTLISLILTIIQAIIAMLNGQPINEIPLGVTGEVGITLDTLAGTFTATNLWFVTRTPDIPDPPPEPPAGYIGIYDIDDLQAIGNDPAYPLDGDYVLMNDIDASATATWNGGAGFAPIGVFTGTLDGQGFGVTDLYIDRPIDPGVGLIGDASGCTITNCYATGTVTGGGFANVAGGLIGYASGSTITNCYATCAVTDGDSVGGLVGRASGCTITNCYATGAVTGGGYTGGLVGYGAFGLDGATAIVNCYATGAVTGDGSVGGLVGGTDGTVTASYYDTTTSGQADYGKGEPRVTAAMMQQATFIGWDFGVVWTIDEGVDYPRLIWE